MRLRVIAIIAAMLVVVGAGTAQAEPRLALPRPGGISPVGTASFHFTDTSRADPWVPSQRREMMVTLWYPAQYPGWRATQYLTQRESELMVEETGDKSLPKDLLTKVRIHSTVDALPQYRRMPLVVLSPGFTLPRATLSSLAEELASRGYVVAGIGHNYEAIATTFPDGHTTQCVACGIKDWKKLVTTRAQDVSFVLDRFVGPHPAWGGGQLIDARRIAMIGHSIGGASTAPAMLADRRIRAGAMLDGMYYFPVAGLDRPFLQFGAPVHQPGGTVDPSWDAAWREMAGWKRWITVDGGDHSMFTDELLLFQQAGAKLPGVEIDPLRGIRVGEAYLTAFLDEHLRGWHQRLLDGPSPRFPEVRFWG
ncbi:alpha/beta hydrolase family protein [Amycolatopsis circi]|uniref:alpha/beta hydrolase family protein n=1 Tax=Amycolatopsis circi TaxID=871959 RepID=UPI000E27379F|nr:alpha/beta hydrolase [Amycolatopsis circi]